MKHKGTTRIETERLILRRFEMEDAHDMHKNWASEDEVTKYLSWPTHGNVDITNRVLSSWIEQYGNLDYYLWGIELKEIGQVIGNIAVVGYKEGIGSASLGWCIGTRWWGQGIMVEAAEAVIKFLFEEVEFNRIGACHDTYNPNSGRVMQKIGMKYEGTLRSNGKNNQGIVDEVWYSILRNEYMERNRPIATIG